MFTSIQENGHTCWQVPLNPVDADAIFQSDFKVGSTVFLKMMSQLLIFVFGSIFSMLLLPKGFCLFFINWP